MEKVLKISRNLTQWWPQSYFLCIYRNVIKTMLFNLKAWMKQWKWLIPSFVYMLYTYLVQSAKVEILLHFQIPWRLLRITLSVKVSISIQFIDQKFMM